MIFNAFLIKIIFNNYYKHNKKLRYLHLVIHYNRMTLKINQSMYHNMKLL